MLLRNSILLFILIPICLHMTAQEFEQRDHTSIKSIYYCEALDKLAFQLYQGGSLLYANGDFEVLNQAGQNALHWIACGVEVIHEEWDSIKIADAYFEKIDQGFSVLYDVICHENKIWLATDRGIRIFENGNLLREDLGSVLNEEPIRDLEIIGGRLFFVTDYEIYDWSDNLNPFTFQQKITKYLALPNPVNDISGFVQLESGPIIIKSGRAKQLYLPAYERLETIYSLEQQGDLLYLFTKEYPLLIWNTKTNEITEQRLSIPEDARINDTYHDIYGTVWLATDHGLYSGDHLLKKEDVLPEIAIERIFVNDDEVTLHKEIQAQIGDLIKIELALTHWSRYNDIEVSYQQYDGAPWKSVTNHINLEYRVRSLSDELRFRATVDGQNYAFTDSINIKSHDDSWRTYFYALIILGGVLFLIAMLMMIRNRSEMDKLQSEAELLRTQNAALTLEQKSERLQMNPHFIFNVLNSIKGLVALNENKLAQKSIGTFSKMMRAMLEQSRAEMINLQEELQFLKNYVELEQMIREESFDFEIESHDLDVEAIHIPTMIIQPFIENAIIHGVAPLMDRRGLIRLDIMKQDHFLEIRIIDNGVGLTNTKTSKNHTSVATRLTQERLAKYPGAKLRIGNSEEIGFSTEVKILIPFKKE